MRWKKWRKGFDPGQNGYEFGILVNFSKAKVEYRRVLVHSISCYSGDSSHSLSFGSFVTMRKIRFAIGIRDFSKKRVELKDI